MLQAENCTSAGEGWNSELMVIDKGARNATLRWRPDSTAMNVTYVIEYEEEGMFFPIRSEPVSFVSRVVKNISTSCIYTHTCMFMTHKE